MTNGTVYCLTISQVIHINDFCNVLCKSAVPRFHTDDDDDDDDDNDEYTLLAPTINWTLGTVSRHTITPATAPGLHSMADTYAFSIPLRTGG